MTHIKLITGYENETIYHTRNKRLSDLIFIESLDEMKPIQSALFSGLTFPYFSFIYSVFLNRSN